MTSGSTDEYISMIRATMTFMIITVTEHQKVIKKISGKVYGSTMLWYICMVTIQLLTIMKWNRVTRPEANELKFRR